MGRIDNGRPILKVTLCAAENPESGSHTISSIHLVPYVPRVSSLYGEETRGIPLMQLIVSKGLGVPSPPFAWTKMDTAIRGSPGEEIPDSRRRYLGRSVTGHVSSSRRQRAVERSIQGRQALDRMEIRRNNGSTFFLPSYRQ